MSGLCFLAESLATQTKPSEDGTACAWFLGAIFVLTLMAAIGRELEKGSLARAANAWFARKKALRGAGATPEAIEKWLEDGEKLANRAEKGAVGQLGKEATTKKKFELLAGRIRDDIRAFESIRATLTLQAESAQSPTITELARLRSEGMLSDDEFRAFSSRFERTAGEKAQEIVVAIGALHEQHRAGAMGEGNYHASLWTLLDRLDRDTKQR